MLRLALACRQARRLQHSRQWHPRQCMSTNFASKDETKNAVCRLLRETAQPVAVVTSFYPFDGAEEEQNEQRKRFHGATLSSFTSIALDPDPLVAFSLRIPSRMATSLKERMTQERSSEPNLIINMLSSTQADTAHHFARADLFPEPFRITRYTLSKEGLPVLTGALGALSCELISCTPLHSLYDKDVDTPQGVISELFISRVVRVESTRSSDSGVLPLVYHRRKYGTILPH